MKSVLKRVLDNYYDQTLMPFKPTENSLARYLLDEVPEVIKELLPFNKKMYKVQGSVGQGNWTETPWISVFDRTITNTAMKGFYIVYLFRKDMNGVYLSLNQGTTYLATKHKGNKPRSKMREVASKLREALVYPIDTFPAIDIDLISRTNNAQNYMAAHICGKFYSLSDLPNDEEIIRDLKKLILVYRQLRILMGRRNTDQFIDYLLNIEEIEDTQFQSDVQIVSPANTPKIPQVVPPMEHTSEGKKWKRDASIAKEALQNANFQCEFNPSHIAFVSEVTGKNFVEAHHLIPMKLQGFFRWSLDVPGNIVSLCPNCHRKIHHATFNERFSIVEDLLLQRKSSLSDFGIEITLEYLKEAYSKK